MTASPNQPSTQATQAPHQRVYANRAAHLIWLAWIALVGALCFGNVHGQTITALDSPRGVQNTDTPIPVHIQFTSQHKGCGLLLTDNSGTRQHILAKGPSRAKAILRYGRNGNYVIDVIGQPIMQDRVFYPACFGSTQGNIQVESTASRIDRQQAEAAHKKAQREAAAKAAKRAAREQAEREANAREVARLQAQAENTRRQARLAAINKEREALQAQIAAEKRAAKLEAENGVVNQLKDLLSSDSTDANTEGKRMKVCKLKLDQKVNETKHQCAYICDDDSFEGRTLLKENKCDPSITTPA